MMEYNANYYEDDFLEKSAEEIGTSWGKNCWKEVKDDNLETFEKIPNETPCSKDIVCLNCCNRKEKSCGKKYPQKKTKCGLSHTFCVDVLKKT